MAFQLEFESQILHLGAVGWWTSKFTSPNHSSLCAKYIASYVSRPKSSERKMIHLSQCTGSWETWVKVCLLLLLLSLCNPMGSIPPGSSVHGSSQARILEWVAISFSRGSSQTWDWTWVFCIGRWILYHGAPREAHQCPSPAKKECGKLGDLNNRNLFS